MSQLKTYKVRRIHLEITGRCNLKCAYCYNSQFNTPQRFQEEMTTDDIKRLVKEASDMGCKSFAFSGGEPFLRKDIFKIIDFCKNNKIEFLTNGKILTNRLIDKLSQLPQIKEIKITLDGFKQHDYVRRGSNYRQIIKTIKYLKKKKMTVVINTEVTEKNLNEMPKLYEVLKKLKIDRWRVDLPFIVGRYLENYGKFRLPKPKDFIGVFKKILIDYINNKPSFEFELFNVYKSEISPSNLFIFNRNDHPCSYRSGSFPLRPNGDMVFCPSFNMPMSNYIKEGSLKKAISKKYKHKFYKLRISDIKECKKCRYLKLCGCGCRVDAYYYLKDYARNDPIACNLMPLIEKEIIPILPYKLKIYYQELLNKQGTLPKKYDINKIAERLVTHTS